MGYLQHWNALFAVYLLLLDEPPLIIIELVSFLFFNFYFLLWIVWFPLRFLLLFWILHISIIILIVTLLWFLIVGWFSFWICSASTFSVSIIPIAARVVLIISVVLVSSWIIVARILLSRHLKLKINIIQLKRDLWNL